MFIGNHRIKYKRLNDTTPVDRYHLIASFRFNKFIEIVPKWFLFKLKAFSVFVSLRKGNWVGLNRFVYAKCSLHNGNLMYSVVFCIVSFMFNGNCV